jgi:hypothetical protein
MSYPFRLSWGALGMRRGRRYPYITLVALLPNSIKEITPLNCWCRLRDSNPRPKEKKAPALFSSRAPSQLCSERAHFPISQEEAESSSTAAKSATNSVLNCYYSGISVKRRKIWTSSRCTKYHLTSMRSGLRELISLCPLQVVYLWAECIMRLHGDVSTVAALNKQILCFRRELKGSPIAAIRVAGYSDRGTSCRGARG